MTGSAVRGHGDRRERAILVGLELPGQRALVRGAARGAAPAGRHGRRRRGRRASSRSGRSRTPPPSSARARSRRSPPGMRELDADLVIVDHDLSPSQARNLEKVVGGPGHRSHGADPRHLRAARATALAQAAGRAGADGVHAAAAEAAVDAPEPRGGHGQGRHRPARPGREADRDRPAPRPHAHSRPEATSSRRWATTASGRRSAREKWFTVCLVGYTNAGKSTLLRALTGADVFIQDRLFATLDTTTRAWEIAPGQARLPVRHRGVHPGPAAPPRLVLPRDARGGPAGRSAPARGRRERSRRRRARARSWRRRSREIGAGGVPRIAVLNQIDRVRDPLMLRFLEDRLPRVGPHERGHGRGSRRRSRRRCTSYVTRRHLELVVEADPGNGRLLASSAGVGRGRRDELARRHASVIRVADRAALRGQHPARRAARSSPAPPRRRTPDDVANRVPG